MYPSAKQSLLSVVATELKLPILYHLLSTSTKALIYLILLMALFYEVEGAVKCPKLKKHIGIRVKPVNRGTKEPFEAGDTVIFSCETKDVDFKQSIKCQDDGRWSEIPRCPDPSNDYCTSLPPIPNGYFNSTGPYKVGSVVSFRCINDISEELDTSLFNINSSSSSSAPLITSTTTTPLLTATQKTLANLSPVGVEKPQLPINKYNLTGYRVLKCLPNSKWNHPLPSCTQILPPEQPSYLFLVYALVILVPILIAVVIFQLVMRWKRRQEQRERWKQYFTDYKYRHSKTSITFGLRMQGSTQNNNHIPLSQSDTPVPVTDL